MTGKLAPINGELNVPMSEIDFRFSRSSGPGGQRVNRTATRVELVFDVARSPSLSVRQRGLLLERLGRHLDKTGVLHLVVQDTASQWRNRTVALARFRELLAQALKIRLHRRTTRVPRGSRAARLQVKRQRSAVKRQRGPVKREDW